MIKYAKDNRYDKNGVATHDRYIPPPLPGVELVTVSLSVQAGDFSCGCHRALNNEKHGQEIRSHWN